ncbi:MAG TPA: inositol monophosphatase family protein [Candidatus Saccharimonadales bacterium]|nr:inositol monophosphatase family protein [Candidatus Saccharimonadales bacterium]
MERHYMQYDAQEIHYRNAFMEAATRTLGNYALEMIQGDILMRLKEDGSKVTEMDEALNELLMRMTYQYFPNDLVWGEEASNSEKGDLEAANGRWLWIADPIDGTNKLWDAYELGNFDECNSTVLLSAFAPGSRLPTMSAAYSPFRPERLFVAAGPMGAMASLGQRSWPLTIQAGPKTVAEVTTYEYSDWGDGLDNLPDIFPGAERVKTPIRMASIALGTASISAFPRPAHPHDVIPGAHIVQAAGGSVRSLVGQAYEDIDWRVDPLNGVVAAATPELVEATLERLSTK